MSNLILLPKGIILNIKNISSVVISEDGNTIALMTTGAVPLEFVFDFELISNTSFRIRPNEDGDEDWLTFTKI